MAFEISRRMGGLNCSQCSGPGGRTLLAEAIRLSTGLDSNGQSIRHGKRGRGRLTRRQDAGSPGPAAPCKHPPGGCDAGHTARQMAPAMPGAGGPPKLFSQLPANGAQFAGAFLVHGWIGQIERTEGFEDNPHYDQAFILLVVAGDDVPGRVAGAGSAEAGLVGSHVLIPEAALDNVIGTELPVLLRVIEAGEQALALLFSGDMQEEFHDARAVAVKVLLQIDDRAIALLPYPVMGGQLRRTFGGQKLGMDAQDQHLLVVRPVEYADLAALGQRAGGAPKEVVLQFLPGRMLEAEYLAALRVDTRHDVADDAVFAGRVHRLENKEHSIPVGGVVHLLQRAQFGNVTREHAFVVAVRLVGWFHLGRPLGEIDGFTFGDAVVVSPNLHRRSLRLPTMVPAIEDLGGAGQVPSAPRKCPPAGYKATRVSCDPRRGRVYPPVGKREKIDSRHQDG